MTVVTARELASLYPYVISENAVRDAKRLLDEAHGTALETSVFLSLVLREHARDILELEGLGKEVWDGVDPKQYVNELRKGW